MLQALEQVESRPFRLLRLKNNLASEKKPGNLHAVLEYTTKAVGVPLVVEVQLLFDDAAPALRAHAQHTPSTGRGLSPRGTCVWAPRALC